MTKNLKMFGGHWDVYKDIERDTYVMFIAEAVTHISGMVNAYGGISEILCLLLHAVLHYIIVTLKPMYFWHVCISCTFHY